MTLAQALLVMVPLIPAPAPEGESTLYLVTVTRTAQNVYRLDDTCDEDGCVWAWTRHCDEYPVGQKAILEYSPRWDVDNLRFENGKTCDVIGI